MNSPRTLATVLVFCYTLSSVSCSTSRHLSPATTIALQKLIEKYRQVSMSKVLTLNLSNALLLLLLKLTFMGAMYFRSVFKNSHRFDDDFNPFGRSDKGKFTEVDWMDGFLQSADTGDYSCVYKLACDDVNKTNEYLSLTQKVLRTYRSTRRYLPYSRRYEDAANAIRDAIKSGKINCRHKHTCKKRN